MNDTQAFEAAYTCTPRPDADPLLLDELAKLATSLGPRDKQCLLVFRGTFARIKRAVPIVAPDHNRALVSPPGMFGGMPVFVVESLGEFIDMAFRLKKLGFTKIHITGPDMRRYREMKAAGFDMSPLEDDQ